MEEIPVAVVILLVENAGVGAGCNPMMERKDGRSVDDGFEGLGWGMWRSSGKGKGKGMRMRRWWGGLEEGGYFVAKEWLRW